MKSLPSYESVMGTRRRPAALPAKRKDHHGNLTLVLDLDETLVHCSVEPVPNPDIVFPVNFQGVEYNVFVRKRPHMDEFLRAVSRLYEVVIFTASHRVYADKLLSIIDPGRELIQCGARSQCPPAIPPAHSPPAATACSATTACMSTVTI